MESSCVVVALIENYSTSKSLRFAPEKSQILSCDIFDANERYIYIYIYIYLCVCVCVCVCPRALLLVLP